MVERVQRVCIREYLTAEATFGMLANLPCTYILGWTVIEKNFVTLLSFFNFRKDNFMFLVFSFQYRLAIIIIIINIYIFFMYRMDLEGAMKRM